MPRSDSGHTVTIGLTGDPMAVLGLNRWVNGVTTCWNGEWREELAEGGRESEGPFGVC